MFVIYFVVLVVVSLTYLQGVKQERASENGRFLQIHPQIITSRATFATGELPGGSSKAVCLTNGS